MKKVLLVQLLTLGVLTGCIGEIEKPSVQQADLKDFVTCEEYNVPVKEGYMSYTTFEGDTIAVTNVPLSIVAPKAVSGATSRATYQGIETTFKLYDKNSYGGNYSETYGWQTVCFENSKNGDHDYNDLIIHPKYQIVTKNKRAQLAIGIHPIAYGAGRNIQLGFRCKYADGTVVKDEIISDNVRRDLFEDYPTDDGFINTRRYDKHYNKFTKKLNYNIDVTSATALYIDWYIICGGETIYAFGQSHVDGFTEVDKHGYPFGVVFMNTKYSYIQDGKGKVGSCWFAYPKERVKLSSCYKFGEWNWDQRLRDGWVFDLEAVDKEDRMRIYEISNTTLRFE